MYVDLADLLDHELSSKTVSSFLNDRSSKPRVIEYEDNAHYSFTEEGISLIVERDKLKAILLYSSIEDNEFSEYKGSLPGGLNFNNSKIEVLKKLGEPEKEREVVNDPILGEINPWVNYSYKNGVLQIQFDNRKENIKLITLMTKDAVPSLH